MSAIPQRRCLLIGGVGLIPRFRVNGMGSSVLRVRNELEPELERNGYFASAPFKTVSLILRCGDREDLEPSDKYKIDRRNQELCVSVQLAASTLKSLEAKPDELYQRIRSVVVDVLRDVSANFDLPYAFLPVLSDRDT